MFKIDIRLNGAHMCVKSNLSANVSQQMFPTLIDSISEGKMC